MLMSVHTRHLLPAIPLKMYIYIQAICIGFVMKVFLLWSSVFCKEVADIFNGMADNECLMCSDRTVVAAICLKGQGHRPLFFVLHTKFWRCTTGLECAPIRLCHGGPAPKSFQRRSHMWSNCPKAYKASSNVLKEIVKLSNVLKEIVKLSKEKYK